MKKVSERMVDKRAERVARSIRADVKANSHALLSIDAATMTRVEKHISGMLIAKIGVKAIDEDGGRHPVMYVVAQTPKDVWAGARRVFDAMALEGAPTELLAEHRERLCRELEEVT